MKRTVGCQRLRVDGNERARGFNLEGGETVELQSISSEVAFGRQVMSIH